MAGEHQPTRHTEVRREIGPAAHDIGFSYRICCFVLFFCLILVVMVMVVVIVVVILWRQHLFEEFQAVLPGTALR